MPELREADLRQQLSSGELLNVYLIAGPEKLLVKRAAGRLVKKAAGEDFSEFNRNEFGAEADLDSIADAAQALPFFAERKCVSVSDLNVEERDSVEMGKLEELLDSLPETTVLVFWYPTLDFDAKKSAKWRNFLKKVQEKGGLLLCEQRTAPELEKLMVREAEKAGCVLPMREAARVVEYAGMDMTRLFGEVEKLCAYALGTAAPGEKPVITAAMVEDLVPKTTETTVFLLSNALVAGNYEKAYSLLDALFYQNEEPIAILGALSSSYVDMCRVRVALESGKSASAAAEYGDYKGREFRLRYAERDSRNLKPEALRKSLELLLEADMALKGSRLDGRTVLEELVAKLLLAAKGDRA